MSQTSINRILQEYNIFLEAESYGNGHINDTYIVNSSPRYILQRINTSVFRNPDELMDNIENVTSFLHGKIAAEGGDPERETLTVINTVSGKNYYRTEDGSVYRMYKFIEDTKSIEDSKTAEDLLASGAGSVISRRCLRISR